MRRVVALGTLDLLHPDVPVLGDDQHHDESEVTSMLAEWGVECEVRRASMAEDDGEQSLSSSAVVERILTERGEKQSPRP